MKRIYFEITLLLLAIVIAMGAFSTAQQQPPPTLKIAYFDFQKILDQSVEGKKAQGALEKKFGDTKEMLKQKATELKTLQDEIEKKKDVWSKPVLQDKMAIFEAKYKTYVQQKMVLQEQYNNEFIKLVSPMQKEINKIVDTIAKEKGYNIVFKFDSSARTEESNLAEYLFFPSSIAYIDAKIDITDELLKRYDAAHR